MSEQFLPDNADGSFAFHARSETPWVYVGFLPRLLATVVDTAIQLAILFVVYLIYKAAADKALADGQDWPMNIVFMVLVIGMWMKFGATPGKMYIKAQVLDARTGQRLRLGQSVIRYVGYVVSSIPFCFGFLSIVWNSKRQGWHDRMAGTVVVRPGRWRLGTGDTPELY